MNRYTKHSTIHTRNWFLILVLLGVIAILINSLIGAAKNIKVSNTNLKEAEVKFQSMYERGQSIEELLKNFQNDFGFEKYVRENFGVIKPGENVVIIVPSKQEINEPREGEKSQD